MMKNLEIIRKEANQLLNSLRELTRELKNEDCSEGVRRVEEWINILIEKGEEKEKVEKIGVKEIPASEVNSEAFGIKNVRRLQCYQIRGELYIPDVIIISLFNEHYECRLYKIDKGEKSLVAKLASRGTNDWAWDKGPLCVRNWVNELIGKGIIN